jgi:hypothetical protein
LENNFSAGMSDIRPVSSSSEHSKPAIEKMLPHSAEKPVRQAAQTKQPSFMSPTSSSALKDNSESRIKNQNKINQPSRYLN